MSEERTQAEQPIDRGEDEGEFETLPPFANARNRELDRQLREKEARREELKREVAEQRERMAFMSQHLRNVELEVASCQGVLDGKANQAENELRLARLAERQAERTRSDIERLKKEERETSERVRSIVAQTLSTQKKLEEFNERMQWSVQELEKWAEAEKAKEDDRSAIERFQRADEAKIKELNLAIEKLTKELHRHEALLEGQTTEARSAQIELGKMEQSFRDLNREQVQLIALCEESVAAVQRRDKELENAEKEVQDLEAQVREKKQALQDKHKFLDSEVLAVQQAQAQADAADRSLSRKREEYGVVRKEMEQLQDELETVKMTMQKVKATVDSARSEVRALEKQVSDQEKRVGDASAALESAKQRAAKEQDQTLTLEQRAKAMEEYLKEEQSRAAQFDKELERLKQESFNASQELYQLKQREINVRSEIEGARAASKNLRAQIRKLDNESMKQQEVLYNQEFQLQELEHRAAKLSGHKTNDEKAQLNKKIQELTAQLEQETQKYHLLTNQHKKAVEGLKAAKREADAGVAEQEALQSAIQTLEAETEKTTKLLKIAAKKKEDLVIQENMVRLDAKRLRDLLYKRADEVYSLEAWRHEQTAAIEEARLAISAEEEALRAQIRTLEEAHHLCVTEQKTREIRVDKLKRKYGLLVSKAASTMGPDTQVAEGQPITQEYLLVQAAQQREELRVKRAALEQEVAKAEADVNKLERTMESLNAHTAKLLEQTRPGFDLTRAESSQKAELDAVMQSEEEARKEKQARFAKVQAELQELKTLLQSMSRHNQTLSQDANEARERAQTLQSELTELNAKVERAKKSFQRTASTLQGEAVNAANRDLSLAELKDVEHAAMFSLGRFVERAKPEISDEIRRTAASLALEMPQNEAPPRSAASTTSMSQQQQKVSSPLPPAVGSNSPGRTTTPKERVSTSRGGDLGAPPINSPSFTTPQSSRQKVSSSQGNRSTAVTRSPLNPSSGKPQSPTKSSRPSSKQSTGISDLTIGGTQFSNR